MSEEGWRLDIGRLQLALIAQMNDFERPLSA
jgi:hypothetical protein